MLAKYNAMLKEEYGKDITVEIKSYIEDDDTVWYYFTTMRYESNDSFASLEEVYKAAKWYLNSL
jgi:uncharacterized protein YvpB